MLLSYVSWCKDNKSFFIWQQKDDFFQNNLVVLFEKCNFSASFYIEKCNWAETAAKIYIF